VLESGFIANFLVMCIITMQLLAGLFDGRRRGVEGLEVLLPHWLISLPDRGFVVPVGLIVAHALDSGAVVTASSPVPLILAFCHNTQVFSAVVEWIIVDVVDGVTWRDDYSYTFDDFLMQSNVPVFSFAIHPTFGIVGDGLSAFFRGVPTPLH